MRTDTRLELTCGDESRGDCRVTNLAYLATPYSRLADLDRAFQQAGAIAYQLSSAGVPLFCPIVHAHAMARAAGQDPKNPAIYEALNRRMLDVCSKLIVVRMEGWSISDGMREEVEFFRRMHKPIHDLYPRFEDDSLTFVIIKREPAITSGESPQAEAELVQK